MSEPLTTSQALSRAWADACAGAETSPRNMPTREVLNWSATIGDITDATVQVPGRNLTARIGAIEACQLVGQTSTPDIVGPSLGRFLNDGVADGAYGLRIHGMLPRVVRLLKAEPATRQAVLSIWNTREDLLKFSRDLPCTVAIQYFVRDQALHTRVSMRSNDVWLGMPYDLIQFGALTAAVAGALGLPVGTYHHSVGSLHVYEEHRSVAGQLAWGAWTPETLRVSWGADSIEDISARARAILHGGFLANMTPFEEWARKAIHP